jgi:hypothetical protein
MAADAVVCMLCGYDTKTGKIRKRKTEVAAKRSASGGSTMTLLRGTLFSFLAAMMAAGLWAVVAFFTGREFGILAWGLGAMAGYGMALGHDDDDGTTAGIIAAVMSFVGIVAAKAMIILIFIAVAVAAIVNRGDDKLLDNEGFQRQLLAAQMSTDKMKAQNIDLAQATEAQWTAAQTAARADVDKLTDDQVAAELKKRHEAAQAQAAEEAKADEEQPEIEVNQDVADDPAEAPDIGFIGLFFKHMFSPIDGLFILFAFFTAYKVGSGQATD